MKALHHRDLARMIHERFCCNRRSAALAREAGARIDSLIHLTIDSMVQWINRQSSCEKRFTFHEWKARPPRPVLVARGLSGSSGWSGSTKNTR